MQLEVKDSGDKEHPWGLYLNGRLLGFSKAQYDAYFAKHLLESEIMAVPRCPKCGSPKLLCPQGHTWEIRE